jgi:hypothetical protein
MSDEDQNIDHTPTAWDKESAISALHSSDLDLCGVRKDMIRYALEHPIRDIRTYSGYKGDLLVEITTIDPSIVEILKTQAESLGMQTVVKKKNAIGIYEVYFITPDPHIYELKLKEPE